MNVDVDVLIVGAGLSGIGAAHRLITENPNRTFRIVERRDAIGGTWDLFRYPGVRSDSDMYTLSYPFKPWTNRKAIADGADIKKYLEDTAVEYGIADRISYGRKVTNAEWSSDEAVWTVTMELADGTNETVRTNFLYLCSGYYNYDEGHLPQFEGADDFTGEVVHPQFWPDDLDWRNKHVAIIGSGATAITLLPAMAKDATKVTMLQRTPTYLVSQPQTNPLVRAARKVLPAGLVHAVTRRAYAIGTVGLYLFCRAFPKLARKILVGAARKQSPADLDPRHLEPPYKPWDQRLCVVPDGDLFKTLKNGRGDIVTGHIDRFTPSGIQLTDGTHIEADIIVTATGLSLVAFGNIDLQVDGRKIESNDVYAYKGTMFSGIPNLAWCIGYTNASWTLRANITWGYVSQFLKVLDSRGYAYGVPTPTVSLDSRPTFDLDAGYIQRAADILPRAGSKRPWTVRQNWFLDTWDSRTHDPDQDMVWVRKSDLPDPELARVRNSEQAHG